MGRKIFSFRLDEELIARVDACSVGRSEFIRRAVMAALDGVECGGGSVVGGGRREDMEVVLGLLSGGGRTSRDLSESVGWVGIRYERCERALMREGLVRFEGGLMVLSGD